MNKIVAGFLVVAAFVFTGCSSSFYPASAPAEAGPRYNSGIYPYDYYNGYYPYGAGGYYGNSRYNGWYQRRRPVMVRPVPPRRVIQAPPRRVVQAQPPRVIQAQPPVRRRIESAPPMKTIEKRNIESKFGKRGNEVRP